MFKLWGIKKVKPIQQKKNLIKALKRNACLFYVFFSLNKNNWPRANFYNDPMIGNNNNLTIVCVGGRGIILPWIQ